MLSPQVQEPAIANQQQDEDSPDQVMNVVAADHDPLHVAFVIHNPVNKNPNP